MRYTQRNMGIFEKMKQAVGLGEEARAQQKINELEELVVEEPKNIEAWEQLAQCYEKAGQTTELRRCCMKLGALYQAAQAYEIALGYYERAEWLFPHRYIPLLKQKTTLYFACQRLEEAYLSARTVIEAYVEAGERGAALSFLHLLPSFGPQNAKWRRELSDLIPGKEGKTGSLLRTTARSIPRFAPEPPAASPATPTRPESPRKPGELIIIEPKLELPGGEVAFNLFTPPSAEEASTPAAPEPQPAQDMSIYKLMVLGRHDAWRATIASQIAALGCQMVEAGTAQEAQAHFATGLPSMVLAQLTGDDWEWYHLFAQMQANCETHDIPFICLSESQSPEELAQALDIGVADCWHWPQTPVELKARVRRALYLNYDERNAILGMLNEISLPDSLQMLEGCRKTGMFILKNGLQHGVIYFSDGRAIDAQFSRWSGEAAFFRLIQWTDGLFRFEPQPVERPEQISDTVQGLLMEAMRRIDEQAKIVTMLPSADQVLYPDPTLSQATPQPPALPRIMELFDGQRTLGDCLKELDMDIEALELVANLYQRGLFTASR